MDNEKESFGKRFARLRKEHNYTQEGIAEQLNVCPQAISKWENDASMPDVSHFPEIAAIFGITTDELFGIENTRKTTVLPPDQKVDLGKMLLTINVESYKGDHVRVNLPASVLKAKLSCGGTSNLVVDNDAFTEIDFQEILMMIESGMYGKLVSVESHKGDHVTITVKKM